MNYSLTELLRQFPDATIHRNERYIRVYITDVPSADSSKRQFKIGEIVITGPKQRRVQIESYDCMEVFRSNWAAEWVHISHDPYYTTVDLSTGSRRSKVRAADLHQTQLPQQGDD